MRLLNTIRGDSGSRQQQQQQQQLHRQTPRGDGKLATKGSEYMLRVQQCSDRIHMDPIYRELTMRRW